ncbi:MAG: hypothetical protein V4450_07440 [Bacteroidota bacterium]
MAEDRVIVVEKFKEIVQRTDNVLFATLNKHLNYEHGSSTQIIAELLTLNNAINPATRAGKYPLIALFQPFREIKGGGYSLRVRIPKIVIATSTNSTDNTETRYSQTFIPILYPIYEELLRQICRHRNVVEQDPEDLKHTKADNPGSPPPQGVQFTDFLDAIEIYDLELTFQLDTNC